MLSVVNNVGAMNAQRQFNITGASIKKSMEKLSSGYKINRAADDAAGLTISEKMRSLIRGMNQGSDNIQDGISVMQIADGALAEVHGMLHRMTELSIKAANGTNTAADRAAIQEEINQLSAEITRIGKTTEFNTMPILDDAFGEEVGGKITNLVSCESAKNLINGKAYLSEFITDSDGMFHPAATMNFSNVNERNIKKLNGGGFSFTCSESCSEVFEFELMTDGRTSYVDNKDVRLGTHYYHVDISKCKNGTDIVNTLYKYVYDNQPAPPGYDYSNSFPGIAVSHSNNMMKTPDGKGLIIFAKGRYSDRDTAMTHYPDNHNGYGAIDCSSLTNIVSEDLVNTFRIQCSNVTDDCEYIETYRMNAKVLGVEIVNVSTEEAARKAISQIDKALDIVSEHRSAYGAFQNRLEHSYANNNNKAENMTAAESQIRDTDMAKEMVAFTTSNILSQAGSAMLSQTMQSPQSILQLLS
ncbi:MAG: hypothetical protein K6E90_09680 [Lachnospiraceae bacterium]|nr:hypothetical protein [Lachnospiraceae bacterium]